MVNVKLRSNLKALTDGRGVSIRQLARDIDYRFDSVRQMYNDEMLRYPHDLLEKLCAYFGVGIGGLFTVESIDNTPE
jgi:transcriptional regulator with XRE-family HTH domain